MNKRENGLIRLGITQGDINGVGYEVIIKTLSDARILDICTPVVYGTSKIASYHRKLFSIEDFSFHIIRNADEAQAKKPNLVNCTDKEVKIEIGRSSQVAGEMSLMALDRAVEDLKMGKIDALLTAPINKYNIQSENFDFPGHTEYLAKKFDIKDFLMILVSENLRVGVVTGHVPLMKVASMLSIDLIYNKIKVMHKSFISDFAIRKPRIAVLGLNPHAGDNGVIGDEELKIIIPAIKKATDEGMLVYGPYPADGFFATSEYKTFDGVLAMYHDQGLIPFKTMCFDNGVNYTAGLPIVRTSPDHGTGYDIAGKDKASPDSFRSALYAACDIYKNREMHKEITANPLKIIEKNEAEGDISSI